jgi:hypothetical protein
VPPKGRSAKPKQRRRGEAAHERRLAADDALREALRTADMGKFDRALAKAIRPRAAK